MSFNIGITLLPEYMNMFVLNATNHIWENTVANRDQILKTTYQSQMAKEPEQNHS